MQIRGRLNRFGTVRLPREKGIPYTMAEILMERVNLEDDAIIEIPPLPKFRSEKVVWSDTVKHVFWNQIIREVRNFVRP